MTTRKMRRRAARGRDDMLGMLIACIGAAALIAFIAPQLLLGPYGLLFGAWALLAILLAVVFHLRQGGSLAGAFLLVLFTGSLTAGSMYGIWWYCFVHLPAQPDPFGVRALGQSVQQPTQPDTPARLPTTLAVAPSPELTTCGVAGIEGVEALALRAEPSKGATQLDAVPRGEVVDLVCTPTIEADDIVWQKVRRDDVEGWMSTRFLSVK